jgi:cation transport regulator
MPFNTVDELPCELRRDLPRHAQELYVKAYNDAWEKYEDPNRRLGGGSREEIAQKVAWEEVEKEYVRDENGNWRRLEPSHA